MILFIKSFFIFVILLNISYAETKNNNAMQHVVMEARPLAHNPKIKFYVYKPDYIYKYVGAYEYQAHIKFEQGEVIKTISMGNTSGWEMVPNGNRLFLRPINQYAKTNMTLITNKRLYQFLLEDFNAKSYTDPRVSFETRFEYSDKNQGLTILDNNSMEIGEDMDFQDTEKYNFNYTFSGPDKIAPIKIFDDGEFTYFQFPKKNAEIPAIFYVDSDGYEGLVNFRVKDDFIIVERLSSIFTLRHGTDTICVFNETMKKSAVKSLK